MNERHPEIDVRISTLDQPSPIELGVAIYLELTPSGKPNVHIHGCEHAFEDLHAFAALLRLLSRCLGGAADALPDMGDGIEQRRLV